MGKVSSCPQPVGMWRVMCWSPAPHSIKRACGHRKRLTVMGQGGQLRVSGTTRLYGIFGHPIAHSLSPLMHTLAFRQHGLDCLYVPFPVRPEQLATAVAGAVALGICGFN